MTFQLCKAHPHLKGVNTDLAPLTEVFEDYLSREDQKLKERVSFKVLDFFKDDFPTDVDAIMFGNILHDWNDEVKKMLIKKTFEALPKGGHIVVYDFFFDEKRREKTDVFLMSLHMQLVLTGNQFKHSEMKGMLEEAGFTEYQAFELDGYNDVAIARKP